MAGSAAVLQLMEPFTQASKPGAGQHVVGDSAKLQKLFKVGLQAISLLGPANYALSMRRRESVRPLLKQDLAASLCGTEIPVTNSLFGDEFSRCLKEAKQVAQMSRDIGHGSTWKKGDHGRDGSKNFRGKWNGWKPKHGKYHKNRKDEK